jgi:hypothetical protein
MSLVVVGPMIFPGEGGLIIFKSVAGALVAAGLLAAGLSAPANATVVYNLTFDNSAGTVVEGTGVLTLNLATVADAYGLNTNNLSIFTSVSTTDINGHGSFLLTPANVSQFYIQTSLASDPPAGHIYTLTVAETVPQSNYNGTTSILILDLYTNTWQIHGQYDSTIDSGKLLVAGPYLGTSATPLPAGLPLFATGLGTIGLLVRRVKRRTAIRA